jgi:hypothetical protein
LEKLRTVNSFVTAARLHTNFRPGSSHITFGKAARSTERFAVVRKKEKVNVGACSKEETKTDRRDGGINEKP